MNPGQQVLEVLHGSAPIALPQGINVTVVYEYAPGKIVMGLGEPGYLLATVGDSSSGQKNYGNEYINTGSVDLMAATGKFNSDEEEKEGSTPSLVMIEDPQVKNKVCCSIVPLDGFDCEKFPFLVARNRFGINLLNVKTASL